MDGGDIISRHSRFIPVIGVVVIFALAFVCFAPLQASISNTQNNIDNIKINNNYNINSDFVKASATTQDVNENLNVSKNQTINTTKTVKTTVKVTKMPLKQYKGMVSYINKYQKKYKVQPKSYNWKSKNLTISKASYLDAMKRYKKWVKTHKKTLPKYVNIFNGVKTTTVNVQEEDATNNDVKKTSKLPLAGELSGYEGLDKLQKYMNANFNHQTGGPSTFEGVIKSKVGDCWGLAEWAAQQLKANNYEVRIVQGPSSSASNHRWVQVKLDGKWINFESSLVTKKYGSKHYSTTCASVSKIVCYL